jgi:hypothetical protein
MAYHDKHIGNPGEDDTFPISEENITAKNLGTVSSLISLYTFSTLYVVLQCIHISIYIRTSSFV